MAGFLDYHAGDTVLHRLNPIVKILLALSICIAAFASENFAFLLFLLALDIALGFLGGIRKETLRLLFGLVNICIFLFILQVLFIRSGTVVFLFVTDEGLKTASLVVLRLIDATMPLALILMLTKLNDLTNALVRIVRLPYKYAFTLTTALRLIPVFTTEMSLIMEAQTARGIEFDTRNPVKKIALILPLCAPLLLSSVGRIEHIAMSAESRGFYLRTRTSGIKTYRFGTHDLICFMVCVALIAFGILI